MDCDLQVWDTPTPPDLQNYILRSEPKAGRLRFYTINVNEISGISFRLTRLGNVIKIYLHDRRRHCVEIRNNDVFDLFPLYGVWIYVPLPRHDPLTQFGCLVRPNATGHYIPNYFCCLVGFFPPEVQSRNLIAQSSARLQLAKPLLGGITSTTRTGSLLVTNNQQLWSAQRVTRITAEFFSFAVEYRANPYADRASQLSTTLADISRVVLFFCVSRRYSLDPSLFYRRRPPLQRFTARVREWWPESVGPVPA